MTSEKTARIREINDAFRTTLVGGRVMMTAAVSALPPETVAAALRCMQTFSEFTEDNDPYGLHDFGSLSAPGLALRLLHNHPAAPAPENIANARNA